MIFDLFVFISFCSENIRCDTEFYEFGDHRIAMTSAIACTRANKKSYIEDTKNVTTSFPNFLEICEEVGLDIK